MNTLIKTVDKLLLPEFLKTLLSSHSALIQHLSEDLATVENYRQLVLLLVLHSMQIYDFEGHLAVTYSSLYISEVHNVW